MKRILLAIVLLASVGACGDLQADVLPFIDRLDMQVGPGIAILDLDPFTSTEVLLATAKVYEEKYSHIEFRIGGLLETTKRALVLGIARDINDLVTRADGDEQKSLIPTIGIWTACDIVEDAEGKRKLDWMFGFNAVLLEY